jgi:glutamate 5-kinase
LLVPVQEREAARKRWLAGQLQARGSLVIDDGAVRVLREQGSILLAVGVCDVKGGFGRGEVVVCLDVAGNEIARGLVNYDAQETSRLMGKSSSQIEQTLGYVDEEELIHRDNLVLL